MLLFLLGFKVFGSEFASSLTSSGGLWVSSVRRFGCQDQKSACESAPACCRTRSNQSHGLHIWPKSFGLREGVPSKVDAGLGHVLQKLATRLSRRYSSLLPKPLTPKP